jgi:hypothetical protein
VYQLVNENGVLTPGHYCLRFIILMVLHSIIIIFVWSIFNPSRCKFSFKLPTSFTLNKTFRIVIVPGDDGVNNGGPNSKTSSNKMDYSDYNGVIKNYNIDDSNVRKLNKDFNIR